MPCVLFPTGKNLFQSPGNPVVKTGFSLCGKSTQGNPCSAPLLALYRIAVHDYWMVVYVWQLVNWCSGDPFSKRSTYKEGKKGFCLASLAFILVVRVYVKDITLVYVSHKKDVKNEWNFFSYILSSLCYIGVIKLWSFFFKDFFFSISYTPYLGIYFGRKCSCVICIIHLIINNKF